MDHRNITLQVSERSKKLIGTNPHFLQVSSLSIGDGLGFLIGSTAPGHDHGPPRGDLQFTDIDTDEYYLEGLIQWSPPPDESVVDSYDVWIVPDQETGEAKGDRFEMV